MFKCFWTIFSSGASDLSNMPFVNRAFIIVTTFVAVLDKIGSSLIDFQNGSCYLNSSYQDSTATIDCWLLHV